MSETIMNLNKLAIKNGSDTATYIIKDSSAISTVSLLDSSLIFTLRNDSSFSIGLPFVMPQELIDVEEVVANHIIQLYTDVSALEEDVSILNNRDISILTNGEGNIITNIDASGFDITVTKGSISVADEKVKVNSTTSNTTFPLLAAATSSVTNGSTYETIYDSGIVINPSLHSVAEGSATIAYGIASHAEGVQTIASGNYSHAEGQLTNARGNNSHAEGGLTDSSGSNSHAEGRFTQTLNNAEHAQGSYNKSHLANSQSAFGTESNGTLHSIGIGISDASRYNAVEVMYNGDVYIKNIGSYDGSNYLNASTLLEVVNSQINLEAGENISIDNNKINALGYYYDSSINSFIELPKKSLSLSNYMALPNGAVQVSGNANETTYNYFCAASEFYNLFEELVNGYMSEPGLIVGIKVNNHISYIQSIDITNKNITLNTTLDAVNPLTNLNMSDLILQMVVHISGNANATTYSIDNMVLEFAAILNKNPIVGIDSYPYKKIISVDTENNTITLDSTLDPNNNVNGLLTYIAIDNNIASGTTSHAEGLETNASGECSHAEGYHSTASGRISHSEGNYTTATKFYSHAEGDHADAAETASHAEGSYTRSSGTASHAEGKQTIASGYASHAEGQSTTASGTASHAEGDHTIATNIAEHADGKYNQSHTNKTIHSIGIGTSNSSRTNAVEVMNDGSVYVYGIGNYNGSNYLDASTLQEVININAVESIAKMDYVIASTLNKISDNIGLNKNFDVSWSASSGIPENYSIKEAVEYAMQNGSGSYTLAATSPISVSFSGTDTSIATFSHVNSGVTTGTYGTNTAVPVLTIDATGHITNATASNISFPALSRSVSGDGNAVTDIAVSGHTITVYKETTFATLDAVTVLSNHISDIYDDISTLNERGITIDVSGNGNVVSRVFSDGHLLTVVKNNIQDEKVKVNSSTANIPLPLLAVASDFHYITDGSTYETIYDDHIILNPYKHSLDVPNLWVSKINDHSVSNNPKFTDENVKQSSSITDLFMPILGAYTSSPTSNTAGQAYYNLNIAINTSTNTIKVNSCRMTYDTAEECMKFTFV